MTVADTWLPLLIGLAFSCGLMAALWQVQRKTGNAGIVDVAWSGIVGTLGVFYAAWPAGIGWLRATVAAMIGIWSLRLTIYLFRRVVGHPEEGRYVKLRETWGEGADRRFFRFYQAQAAAAWCFALPVLVICRSADAPATGLVALALGMWTIGVLGVSLSDRQLERFKADSETAAKLVGRDFGGIRGTPTTFLSGSIGAPTFHCRWGRLTGGCRRWWQRCCW